MRNAFEQEVCLDMSRSGLVSIDFPKDGRLRARNIVTRSRSRSTNRFPSLKMGRMIQGESRLELLVFKLLEADINVISFSEQPAVLKCVINGEDKRHIPDLLVITQLQKIFIEVKDCIENQDPEFRVRTRFLERTLPRFGYGYQVIYAGKFRDSPEIYNADYLLRFGRGECADGLIDRSRRLLYEKGSIKFSELFLFDDRQLNRDSFCQLALRGYLDFDRSKLLSDDTLIYRADRMSKAEGIVLWE